MYLYKKIHIIVTSYKKYYKQNILHEYLNKIYLYFETPYNYTHI
jgi:hypothetical protein